MDPYGNKIPGLGVESRIGLLKQGMEAYVADAEAQRGPMAPERRQRMLDSDAQALMPS